MENKTNNKNWKADHELAVSTVLAKASFFFLLLKRMKVIFDDVPTACIGFDRRALRPTIRLSKEWYNSLPTINERVGVILHELLHYMMGHLTTRDDASRPNRAVQNIAMDIAINQLIQEEFRLESMLTPSQHPFKSRLGTLPEKLNWEQYYDLMSSDDDESKKEPKEPGKDGDESEKEMPKPPHGQPGGGGGNGGESEWETLDSHEWEEFDDLAEAVLKNTLRETMDEAIRSNSWGNCPVELQKMILALINRKAKVKWESVIKNRFARLQSMRVEPAWTKRNKKIPGLAPGYKTKRDLPKALFAIDQSGSMDTGDLQIAVSELKGFQQYTSQFDLCYFDTEMGDLHPISNWQDIKKFAKRERCGGTDFNCVSEYADSNGYDIVIIFTDMGANKPDEMKKAVRLFLTVETTDYFELSAKDKKVIFSR